MTYAIIETSGKQLWIEKGKFYDVDYINGQPGDIINLNRVLLINKEDKITLGHPCITSFHIKAQILRHIKNNKIIVLKMKAKKNYKVKQGHRQKMTRLLIKDI